MKIKQETVEQVVANASKQMADANYSATMVGGFVQSQSPIAQFVSAHDSELGGAEAIVNVIFHCSLIAECIRKAGGKVRTVSYDDLDRASQGDSLAALEKKQPALADFIASNVEKKEAQGLIALISLALVAVA